MSNAKDAINSANTPAPVAQKLEQTQSPPGHDHRKLTFCTQCDRVVRISPAGIEVVVPDHTAPDHYRVMVVHWKSKEQREEVVGSFLSFTAGLVMGVQQANEAAAAAAAVDLSPGGLSPTSPATGNQ